MLHTPQTKAQIGRRYIARKFAAALREKTAIPTIVGRIAALCNCPKVCRLRAFELCSTGKCRFAMLVYICGDIRAQIEPVKIMHLFDKGHFDLRVLAKIGPKPCCARLLRPGA